MMGTHELSSLTAECERLSRAFLADNTRKSYLDSWQRFTAWCASHSRDPLPATGQTVSLWVAAMLLDGLRITTVEMRMSGLSHYHRQAGYPSPINDGVRAVLAGARRQRTDSSRCKRALTPDQLWKISRLIDTSKPRGVRDRAIIVLGFAGAFRRSELSALNMGDVAFTERGLLVHLRASKTDPFGKGRDVGIFRGGRPDTCPIRCLQAWIDCRGNAPGPLFPKMAPGPGEGICDGSRLAAGGIVDVLKRGVVSIGLDPHQYAGHSLRSGFCTTAADNGASEIEIMLTTGHKSAAMVHRYIRPVSAFGSNPLEGRM